MANDNTKLFYFLLACVVCMSFVFYIICRLHGNTRYDDWGFLYYDVQYFGLFIFGFIFNKIVKRYKSFWIVIAICGIASAVIMLCMMEFVTDRIYGSILFQSRAIVSTFFVGIALWFITNMKSMVCIFLGKLCSIWEFIQWNIIHYNFFFWIWDIVYQMCI